MALETGSHIADLNPANPAGTDPKSQGDDHLRLIKAVLKTSFAGFAGAVAVTGAEAQGASENDYVVSVTPAPAAYSTSMIVVFKATHANTGAATLRIGALAAKALKAGDGGALEAADIEHGALVAAFYDGTDFLLISGNDRAARGGETYAGAHDFTAATARVATQGAGDGSTKAASTAYVDAADALKADLASPALTGAPTAPTAAPGTNDTQIATTAFATQLAFQAATPVQAGADDPSFLFTDGANAAWGYTLASQAEAEAGAASDRLMTPVRTAEAIAAQVRSAPDVIIQRQVSQGTAGASHSGGVVQIDINTIVRNIGALASLSSGDVTLPAGVYLVRASVSGRGQPNGGAARAEIYDHTNTTTLLRGEAVFLIDPNSNAVGGCTMPVVGVITLADTTVIRLRARSVAAWIGGNAVGDGAEVYATLEITPIPE